MLAPARAAQRPRLRLHPLEGLGQRHELDARSRRPARPPRPATQGPPTTSGRAARCRSRRPAARPSRSARGGCARRVGDGREELASLLARTGGPGVGVADLAADRPDPGAAQRLAVEVGVRRVGRIAVERPEPRDRLPVDREGDRARRRSRPAAAPRRDPRGRSGRCRRSRGRARRAAARGPARTRTRAARCPPGRRTAGGASAGRRRAGAAGPPSVATSGSTACVALDADQRDPALGLRPPEDLERVVPELVQPLEPAAVAVGLARGTARERRRPARRRRPGRSRAGTRARTPRAARPRPAPRAGRRAPA